MAVSFFRTCTRLIGVPVDSASLNAIMRLTLRLTRDYKMAIVFSEEQGPSALLKLTEKTSFPGAIPLAALLLRHIVEDVNTLQQVLETIICAKTHGVGNIVSGVGQNSVGTKELHYVLRILGPAACRCPELFKAATKKLLRIEIPTQHRRTQTDEHELTIPPNSPQILKIVQSVKSPVNPGINLPLKELVAVLLDSLVELHVQECKDLNKESGDKAKVEKEPESEAAKENEAEVSDLAESIVQQADLVRRLTGEPVDEEDSNRKNFDFNFTPLCHSLCVQFSCFWFSATFRFKNKLIKFIMS